MVEAARITVLAGVNGAGKSSIAGELIRARGGEYFNPDEVTRALMKVAPSMSLVEANGLAWAEGRKRLSEAIRQRQDYTFETTLGGSTIPKVLAEAIDQDLEVAIFYVGLASVELHIERVRSRVRSGGHHIPEGKIRERYTSSMQNLVKLARKLSMLRVFDNSIEADPKEGLRPEPRDLLHAEEGRLVRACDLLGCPNWAKPVFTVFLRES